MRWLTQFIDKKIKIARSLYEGGCGGSEQEAAIILTSLISATSSELWPGEKNDRNRFVELCIQFCDPKLNLQKISLPLLIETLHKKSDIASVAAIKDKFRAEFLMFPGNDTLVVTGEDVDLFENEITPFLMVDTVVLREHSYANLLYKEVRCGFVHEFRLGERSASVPMASGEHLVSYVNRGHSKTRRLIHFSYEWLESLVISISENLKDFTIKPPFEKPPIWWLN